MENSYSVDPSGTNLEAQWQPVIVLAEVVPEQQSLEPPPPPPRQRRVWLPLFLFVATCLSTFGAGFLWLGGRTLREAIFSGLAYSSAVMTILLCHEMGHFVQAWRYRVYASWPYFIPMPISPIGTFGAVIAMEARKGDRRALFDIGISGPLAGLVPTMIFLLVGLHYAHFAHVPQNDPTAVRYGDPLLVQYLVEWMKGPVPYGHDIILNPLLFAGWVGLLVTSLNLFPIGQLDGGHILYGLIRRKAHVVATVVLAAAIGLSVYYREILWQWWPMLVLLMFVVGTRHPPTANDYVPLGWFRHVLGWLTLAFLPLGFTPQPFVPSVGIAVLCFGAMSAVRVMVARK